jgi:transcriptional regulator with XRE-family HTH domain
MAYGSPWSKQFVAQLADSAFRREFVADQVRTRIALLIRALREQKERQWTQAELGRRAGKPQNVISRLEDPDYGKSSLQTLLEVAAAFDLPLWVDLPEWEDWLSLIRDVPNSQTKRTSFDLDHLSIQAEYGTVPVNLGVVGQLADMDIIHFVGHGNFSPTLRIDEKDAEIARLKNLVLRLQNTLLSTISLEPERHSLPGQKEHPVLGNSISAGTPLLPR